MTKRVKLKALLLFAVVLGLSDLAHPAPPAAAQENEQELREEIEILKKGQQEIRKQLDEIKKLLQTGAVRPARPSGPNVTGVVFDLATNQVKGADTAKLTLIEFTDYQ